MPAGFKFKSVNPDNVGNHTLLKEPFHMRYAWVSNNGTLDYVTIVYSHEIVEACTDLEGSAIQGAPGTCKERGWC